MFFSPQNSLLVVLKMLAQMHAGCKLYSRHMWGHWNVWSK